MLNSLVFRSVKVILLLTILIFHIGLTKVQAEVRPGDVIGPHNWEKIKDIAWGMLIHEVKNGYTFKIGKTRPFTILKEYYEATDKYSPQVKLGPDEGLINYVAGWPFPRVSKDDPQAGLKMAWNFYWRFRGDDFDWGAGAYRWCVDKNYNMIEAGVAIWYLKPTGRVSVPPVPVMKGFEDIEEFNCQVVTHPRDSAGTAVMWKRYFDPTKWDDQWIYLPSVRRIRRFPTSQRCSTRAPTDYTWDDSWGFQGKITMFNYKFVGEKDLLVCAHQKRVPYKHDPRSLYALDEEWEVKHVYIVEQTPKDPSYCYSKRVFYLDPESWEGVLFEYYDRKGELWKTMNCYYGEGKTADGRDVYFATGGSMRDEHTWHRTVTQVRGQLTNVGLVPDNFSLGTLLSVGRGGKIR